MAKKSSSYIAPSSKTLSVQDMQLAIRKLQRRLKELEALNPDRPQEWDVQSAVVLAKIADTMVGIFGADTNEYQRWNVYSLDHGPLSMGEWGNGSGRNDRRQYQRDGLAEATSKLGACIETLVEKIEDAGGSLGSDPIDLNRVATTTEPTGGVTTVSASTLIPASDRVVTLNDNEPHVTQVRNQLVAIHDKLRGANSDAGKQAEQELMASIAILNSPQARISVLEELVVKLLVRLHKTIVDEALKALVWAAAIGIAALCGYHLTH